MKVFNYLYSNIKNIILYLIIAVNIGILIYPSPEKYDQNVIKEITSNYTYDKSDVKKEEIIKKSNEILYLYKNRTCKEYTLEELYEYFNSIRRMTGMLELDRIDWLEQTSQNHSKYLYKHRITSHRQNKSKDFFTGIKPKDRAIYVGSDNNYILEGISTHGIGQTGIVYIDRLMAAIYHRFSILDFNTDLLGIGISEIKNNCMYNFVHNQSNSYLNYYCQNDVSYDKRSKTSLYCNDSEILSEDAYFSFRNIRNSNPQYVQWPVENQDDVWTKFVNNETPNPMPNHKVTGYPISIQFNRFNYKPIKFIDFKIFDDDFNQITNTKILRKETDHNKSFDSYEFALFPIELLEKNSWYYITFTHEINDSEEDISWSFKTGNY